MTEHNAAPGDSDHDLVLRTKNGDKDAFDQLMVRHQAGVSSYLRRYSASPHVVEDLAQTVFVKAYVGIDGYRPIAPFVNWLKTIASRVGYDYWRGEKRGRAITFPGDMDAFADYPVGGGATAEEEFSGLSRVIDCLPAEDKQVLYMLHVDGLSIADIAGAMGWNLSMTKMRAFRARRKVRALLKTGKG